MSASPHQYIDTDTTRHAVNRAMTGGTVKIEVISKSSTKYPVCPWLVDYSPEAPKK
jgi:hypothetical protein